MDCKEFNCQIDNFIKKNITEPVVMKEFVEHFKECDSCRDEAQIIYSMLRTLDDIDAPKGKDFGTNYDYELEYIIDANILKLKNEHKKIYHKVIIILLLLIFVLFLGIILGIR